jgi:hypothetical protein
MAAPASTAHAVEMVLDGLGYLAALDPTALAAKAKCLQALGQGKYTLIACGLLDGQPAEGPDA